MIEEVGLIESNDVEVDKMFYGLPAIYVRTPVNNEWAYQNPAIDVMFSALQNIQKEGQSKAEQYLQELQTISALVIKYQASTDKEEFIESQLKQSEPEIKQEPIVDEVVQETIEEQRSERTKITERWRNKLSDGEVLTFIDDPSVKGTWKAAQAKIEYNGQLYSISKLAQELKGTTYPVQGPLFWMNSEGVLIVKL